MRSFKSKVLSAWAWGTALTTAAVLPQGHKHSLARPDGKQLLEFDLQETYAQATFSVPCAGCLGHEGTSQDDDSLVLSFKAHSSEHPCGASNVTLNGVFLPQEWKGDAAIGSGSFSSVSDIQPNAWYLQHDLDLEWETKCLRSNKTAKEEADEPTQLLTVAIKSIDGKPIDKPSGFTISFKQSSPPELLRLEATPNRSASDKAHAEAWREPPPHLRLILSPVEDEEHQTLHSPGQSSLEDEIRELRALQAEVQALHRVIKEKKKHIKLQLKKEAESFKERLQKCDSITCVIKTITNKAHGAWRILYISFRPKHHRHHGPPHEGDQVWRAGDHKQVPEGDAQVDAMLSTPPPHDGPRPHMPGHHGPPPHGPPPHGPPPHGPPPHGPPPHGPPPHGPPPHGPPPHGPHPHGPPHGHRHGPPPESPYVVAVKILVGVLCCGCIFAVIRQRCCSLQTRTDRAALREERRNARAYRRAARKQAWRNWWSGSWRDQERIEDYEEKRSLIQEQESVLEEAMQEEIRQLRAVHGVVNSLVQAEEGRANAHSHLHCHCHAHPHPPVSYSPLPTASAFPPSSLAELASRPLSRTNSLPEYLSDASIEPPAYEEDEDMSDIVVNGFRQYSPSTSSSSSRWTPDSSIIDVSPRPSAETLRYAEIAETGVGDVKC